MNDVASDQHISSKQESGTVKRLTAAEALVLAAHDAEALAVHLTAMRSDELARLLLACENQAQRLTLLRLIPDDQRGQLLLDLPESVQEGLLAALIPSEIEAVVEPLDSDDAADILQAVDEDVAEQVIARLEPEERREIEPLMEHDEESAGGLMQIELFKVRDDWPVSKVLDVLRRWGREIENLNYVYVVNDDDQLLGTVPLYELLFSDPDKPIMEIAGTDFP
ncbi:MAG: CBS domain-containing protein, partial [Mariprofundaceae bacterium]